jgi:hypothetical protein
MKLSENFTLAELTVSQTAARFGWDNEPNEQELENLKRLAQTLEKVRDLLGKPVLVNSAFRSQLVNTAIGSVDNSQHRTGCAADIKVPGMSPKEVVRVILASGIEYDQLIEEFSTPQGGGWTHISVPNTEQQAPRFQALIIDRQGTRAFA